MYMYVLTYFDKLRCGYPSMCLCLLNVEPRALFLDFYLFYRLAVLELCVFLVLWGACDLTTIQPKACSMFPIVCLYEDIQNMK